MDTGYAYQAEVIRRHIEMVPDYRGVREALQDEFDLSPDTLSEILGAAATFAEERLVSANKAGDLQGCRLVNGRVLTPDAYKPMWAELTQNGWNSVDQPAEYGGQGLPSFINAGCRELFDRACMAIGMLSGPTRAGTLLLQEFASQELRDEWIPKFVSGEWSATICISEADAGSDVGRIRTRATPDANGDWRVTGEKMWTSFGDNDLVQRVGHLLLARTPEAPEGTAGLSLFLVPSNFPDASGNLVPNGVSPRRIEEKLGLHGSPTCAMGFDGAKAILLGELNRGIQQMFMMIQAMRLMVAIEGVGMAFGAEQTALRFASERRQGGHPGKPPVFINTHADIQRQLLAMASRVEVLRGLVYELALRLDAERYGVASDQVHRNVTQWLLPIAKASCAEAAFEVPSAAIQVLGGGGYTREWPCEQWMRDARMMSIAEGSTGIQALDLLHRRLWRDSGATLQAFIGTVTAEVKATDGRAAETVLGVLSRLRRVGDELLHRKDNPRSAEAGAVGFLQLAMLATTGWIAARLIAGSRNDPIGRRLVAAAQFWLSDLDARASLQEHEALSGAERLSGFSQLQDAT